MINKGIVEEIVDKYSVRVRIPSYNKAAGAKASTPTSELSVCPICILPNSNPAYAVGDVVYVGYEEDDIGRPVVLGSLYRKKESQSTTNIDGSSLKININCTLPEDTSIGNTSKVDIKNLQGTTSNLQGQIDILLKRIEQLESKVDS